MRIFELRAYTLHNKRALDSYVNEIYPRHFDSFPLFGIEAHGFWTAREDVEPRFFVLASYAAGEELERSVGGICKTLSLRRTSGTSTYRTSFASNRRF